MTTNSDSKRLIFVVTTGRSGTSYLARTLRQIPRISCFHEPQPRFSNVMRSAQTHPNLARQFWAEQKLPAIEKAPHPIYIETSHLFCKGFVEPLLDLGYLPDLILLSRSPRSVAKSFYLLDDVPGRTPHALHWLLSPDDPGVLPLPNWRELHNYQLCYWYCLETERRAHAYGAMLTERGAKVVPLAFKDMFTAAGMWRLVSDLSLPRLDPVAWVRYFVHRGKKANIKSAAKAEKSVSLPPDDVLDELEQEVRSLTSFTSRSINSAT